jgi:hypothetical protein
MLRQIVNNLFNDFKDGYYAPTISNFDIFFIDKLRPATFDSMDKYDRLLLLPVFNGNCLKFAVIGVDKYICTCLLSSGWHRFTIDPICNWYFHPSDISSNLIPNPPKSGKLVMDSRQLNSGIWGSMIEADSEDFFVRMDKRKIKIYPEEYEELRIHIVHKRVMEKDHD